MQNKVSMEVMERKELLRHKIEYHMAWAEYLSVRSYRLREHARAIQRQSIRIRDEVERRNIAVIEQERFCYTIDLMYYYIGTSKLEIDL
jgi:hypothetical protein